MRWLENLLGTGDYDRNFIQEEKSDQYNYNSWDANLGYLNKNYFRETIDLNGEISRDSDGNLIVTTQGICNSTPTLLSTPQNVGGGLFDAGGSAVSGIWNMGGQPIDTAKKIAQADDAKLYAFGIGGGSEKDSEDVKQFILTKGSWNSSYNEPNKPNTLLSDDVFKKSQQEFQDGGQKVTAGEGQTFLMSAPATDNSALIADQGDNRAIVTYQKLKMDDGTTREIARLSDGSFIVRNQDGTVKAISKASGNTTYRPDGTLKETVKDGIKTTYGSDGTTVTASYTIEGPDYVAAAVSVGGTDAVTGQIGIAMNLKNREVYLNAGPSTPGGGKAFVLEAGKIVETGGRVLNSDVVDSLLKEWSRSASFTRGVGANYTWSDDIKALGLTIGYGGGYSESYGTTVSKIVKQVRDSDRVKGAVNLYEEGKMSLQGVLSTIQNEYNSIYTDEYRKNRYENGDSN